MSERKETWRRGAGRGSSRWRNGGTGAAAGGAGAARWPKTLTRRRSRRPSPPPALERVEPECGEAYRLCLDLGGDAPREARARRLKRRARRLLREASAYASTLGGDAQREEKERLLQEAQRLLDERERMQKDLARAVTHPATHHTAAASGSN